MSLKTLGAFIAAISAAMVISVSTASAGSVQGYFKKDGTYVQPHFRSNPDRSYNNNWGVQGNQNPYTGQYGTLKRTLDNRAPKRCSLGTIC